MASTSTGQGEIDVFFGIKPEIMTNGYIINLYNKTKEHETFTIHQLSEFLQLPKIDLTNKFRKLKSEKNKLRSQKLANFLNKECEFKKTDKVTAHKKVSQTVKETTIDTLQKVNDNLKQIIKEKEKKIRIFTLKITGLSRQIATLKRRCTAFEQILTIKRAKYQLLRLENKNLEKHRLRDAKSKLVTKISQQEQKITILQRQCQKLRLSKNRTTTELDNTKEAIEQLEIKISSLKSDLENENIELRSSVTYLETLLSDQNTIQTMDENNVFTTGVQTCIMNLLTEGVGVHHINTVIKEVTRLCGKSIDKLPSISTICRISDQRASVSQMHVAEELQSHETTLMSDETKKHGDSYEVFALRDTSHKNWVIGLRNMHCKSSDTCLETLKKIVSDINDVSKTSAGVQILTNIKNTMSDRAATEKRFHQLLEEYRTELLPMVYSNWATLSDSEKECHSSLNNFYCGLHLLVNFAEIAHKVLIQYETETCTEPIGILAKTETSKFANAGESGTVRLIRTAAKCFAMGADEKSGCYGEFRTFFQQKDKEEGYTGKSRYRLLEQFRGNRFNILFYDAEVVFFLSNHIVEFFTKVSKPSNLLQKAVLYDIEVPLYLASCKALGMCSKLITSPLWRILESNCSIQEASNTYQTLYSFLKGATSGVSDFMCGIDVPFPSSVKKDELYSRLLKEDPHDEITASLLEQLFSVWATLLEKSASDHLEGGKYDTLTEEMKAQTQSVPLHNKFPERVFAFLDALTRFRPAATTLCNEAHIMFALNKTG